jgi:hypothetical protein
MKLQNRILGHIEVETKKDLLMQSRADSKHPEMWADLISSAVSAEMSGNLW